MASRTIWVASRSPVSANAQEDSKNNANVKVLAFIQQSISRSVKADNVVCPYLPEEKDTLRGDSHQPEIIVNLAR